MLSAPVTHLLNAMENQKLHSHHAALRLRSIDWSLHHDPLLLEGQWAPLMITPTDR